MAELNRITTADMAKELGRSTRQVLNYKESVENYLGGAITTRQGKQHFYISEYTDLLRKVSQNEALPEELRGILVQVEQVPEVQSRTVQVISDHPNLEIQNSGSPIAPIDAHALFFTAQSGDWQREGLRQETEMLAQVTFSNITGIKEFLRFQLIEGFRQAATVDVRDAVSAYHHEATQGLQVVATEAQKAGFGSVQVSNVGKPVGEGEGSFRPS